MTQLLKAYTVRHSGDFENALVFDHTARHARSVGFPHLFMAEDFTQLSAQRVPVHDGALREGASEPYCETDRTVLRAVGWRCEGECCCEVCGFAAMDLDEFAVCGDCYVCKHCRATMDDLAYCETCLAEAALADME